eukprot:SAG11_NODE_182_length_13233_cov_59.525238_9_plen_209_part_00
MLAIDLISPANLPIRNRGGGWGGGGGFGDGAADGDKVGASAASGSDKNSPPVCLFRLSLSSIGGGEPRRRGDDRQTSLSGLRPTHTENTNFDTNIWYTRLSALHSSVMIAGIAGAHPAEKRNLHKYQVPGYSKYQTYSKYSYVRVPVLDPGGQRSSRTVKHLAEGSKKMSPRDRVVEGGSPTRLATSDSDDFLKVVTLRSGFATTERR